ncbi:MAG: hypothetical protein ABFS32_01480 [Bacteroidota bacterium]
MKRLIFSITFLSFSVAYAYAQCDASSKITKCAPSPESGYTLIKSFEVDGKGGTKTKIEYSYVFTKGTKYLINVCGGEDTPDGVVVTIYDKYRNKVATSLVNGEVVKAIAYPCTATGIYYITYTFQESEQYCGGSTIGFKRLG